MTLPSPTADSAREPDPAPRRHRLFDGRGYLGLALAGWGLAILLGVTPHEDLLVGAGLTVFGAALIVTAPRLPQLGSIPPWLLASLGALVAGGITAYCIFRPAPWDIPKAAILLLGLAVAVAAPFLHRTLPVRARGGRPITVGTAVASALVVAGAPLAAWAMQAAFKSAIGQTPTEAFVRVGLLAPIGAVLSLFGMQPSIQGQTVTYATASGPMGLEVGAACSGVQAMALFGVVLAVYLFAERPAGRQLSTWTLIGIGGVYLANLLRILMLFVVGFYWGPDAVLQAHAQAGWMFFVAWAILFAWLARAKGHAARPRPA